MSGLIKNGGLEFGEVKPPSKLASPRSPVGRTDKRTKESQKSVVSTKVVEQTAPKEIVP